MSVSRKRQESNRTAKVGDDQQNNTITSGQNHSVLSICSVKQAALPGQYQNQFSMNNTPSSQSTSLRLTNQQNQQQQQSYEHISNSQTKQVKNSQSTMPSQQVLGKKQSLKHSQRKQTSQKQTQALISTSNSASFVQQSMTSVSQDANKPSLIMNTSANINGATSSSSANNNNGSNSNNFSCLIQKQLTSSNYGGAASSSHPQYTSKSGVTAANQNVTRSLEKLSYKVVHSSSMVGATGHENGVKSSTGASQSQHNSVSLARVQHIVAGNHHQHNEHHITTTSSCSQQSSQYNRGSQQPQQKQKIKATFKSRAENLQQQSADGKLHNYGGKEILLSRNIHSGIQRTGTNTSEASSVRTGTGQISNAAQSTKRSNGGNNFVSLGGVMSRNGGSDSQQHKQTSLPINSSQSLKNTGGNLFTPVVGSAGPLQNSTKAGQASSTKSGAIGSSILSSSTGYPGQGTIQTNTSAGGNKTLGTKIGVFRADRINSQRGGAGGNHQVTIPSTKLMRPQSSNKSGNESRNGKSEGTQNQQLSSSSISSQPPQQMLPISKRGGGDDSQTSHKKTTSSNAGGESETSYCPKLHNLNSSQEVILRHPGNMNVSAPSKSQKHTSSKHNLKQPHYALGQMITSPNNACLLPGHMIQANGPNSMQASSQATSGTTQQSFLPPQASQGANVLLSASFEKLNLWNGPKNGQNPNLNVKSASNAAKQSAQQVNQQQTVASLRSHQQILRQHQTNMQAYLHGVNNATNQQPSATQQSGSKTSAGNQSLKVKKSAHASGKPQSKSFMTPQRINKNKASSNNNAQLPQQQQQQPPLVSGSMKEQIAGVKASSKAQQYIRNSFMVKHINHGQQQTASSISPRNTNLGCLGVGGLNGNSRNTAVINASTSHGKIQHPQSQSLNTTSTAAKDPHNLGAAQAQQTRHSPIGGLPQPSTSSFHQIASKQKQQNSQQVSQGTGGPKSLNILSKGNKIKAAAIVDKQSQQAAKQSQLSAQQQQQQKLMIDKKTYEDLMSYLVKAECKRMKHQDAGAGGSSGNGAFTGPAAQGAAVKTPQSSNQQQQVLQLLKPSSSNSNLNSINSSKQKRTSPGGRPNVVSNSTATSGKKTKESHLIANSTQVPNQVAFQSQQPVARHTAWQNQTSNSNNLLRSESHSQENLKQAVSTGAGKSLADPTRRILSNQKHGSGQPVNAASKNKVAVSSFMVPPSNILPIQSSNQKAQMLKTTISQTSQSRDASLTSHKTNGQAGTTASQGKGNKISMKQVNAMALFPGNKQNLLTKQGGGGGATRNGKPHQLFVKGSKQVGATSSSQSRNAINLLSGITNSRNNQNQQNNTVYTVSLKSTNNLPFPDMLHQPSPNQTVISSGQARTGVPPTKKSSSNNVVTATTIPTKIIKARSLIRGAAGQAAANGKVMMNVLKKQLTVSNNQQQQAPLHQETLKNNFMGPATSSSHSQKQSQEQVAGQPPRRPIGAVSKIVNSSNQRSSRTGVTDLQLKSMNFPLKDRVQSAKSSSTTRTVQQNTSGNQQLNLQTAQRVSLTRNPNNNGAQSHRESQRYFSRPQGEDAGQGHPQHQSNQKMTIRQPRSTNQSLSSKERQPRVKYNRGSSKHVVASADSQSNKGSRKSVSRTSRLSNNSQSQHQQHLQHLQDSGHKASTRKQKRQNHSKSSAKRQSKRLLAAEAELEQTILSGVQMIADGGPLLKENNEKKDSCDIGADEAMEGMTGGNFNTFGEQAPKDFFLKQSKKKKRSSLEEEEDEEMLIGHAGAGSENLIERIEKQIEAELRERQDAGTSSALHPMFEVAELSNHSIGTHDSNTMDIVAKPPQNSLAPQIDDDCLLQTIQSRERDPAQTLDTHEAQNQSQKAATCSKADGLQNFHYSGSFGIPDSSIASPYKDGTNLNAVERETIAIDPAQLYELQHQGQSQLQQHGNTIDGPVPQNRKTFGGKEADVGAGILLAAKSEEYQDIITEQRKSHLQTLQGDATVSHHKGHFQLINMSFSQENNIESPMIMKDEKVFKPKKNPHNTLVDDSQMMQQSSCDEYQAENVLITDNLQHVDRDDLDLEDAQEAIVAERAYADSEYRKQLLLRVLPKFEKFEQFDELHSDFVSSKDCGDENADDKQELQKKPQAMAVSNGAAQLLRQINLSLGRETSATIIAPAAASNLNRVESSQTANESIDERIETNTVVENECDTEFDYNYPGVSCSNNKGDCQSPSQTSDEHQIKSFETPSLQSPQNSTRIELQTPSNVTSALQSHYASQNTTNQDDQDHAETRLILLQSSEPESNRKQGGAGAFAVCSPRTAALASAIYDDGANGGRQAVIAMSSVRNSKQINEQDMILPQFGCLVSREEGSNQEGMIMLDDDGEELEEELNQSFQTVLAGEDVDGRLSNQDGGTTNTNSCQYYDESVNQVVTSFYGPEKPQYDEMVSIIQHNGTMTMDDDELMDEQTVSQIDANPSPYQDSSVRKLTPGQSAKASTSIAKQQKKQTQQLLHHVSGLCSGTQILHASISNEDGEDTGGGSQAHSQSPHSIEQFRKVTKAIGAKGSNAAARVKDNGCGKTMKLATAGQVVEEGEGEGDDEDEDNEEEDDDDDQFQFVENLNKQYADAMQQRKFMKMMNRPRQNSC